MNAQNAPPLAGLPDTRPRAYEAAHRALARRAAAESIVLLQNEGTVLPLAVGSRLALYGAGALQMVKGGTGSGDVNARPAVEIYDGLQRAGFTVTNRAWLRCAADVYSEASAAWRDCIRHKLKTGEEPHFFAAYIRTPFRSPALPPPEKTDCDAALYVVSRTSGEGFDRTPDAGDFCLSDAERRDLRILCGFGKPVILVLNIGGVMDLSPLDGLDGVRAVVLLSQPGMEGGSALADVLCGRVNPSGKLTDSWAYRYADYPCAKTGGDEPLTLTYREGIYVGYRYFDTFSVPVRYGFGAGLSYTEFFIRPLPLVQDGDALRLPVQVTNTGLRHAGRETVQVYATCPRGGQDREYAVWSPLPRPIACSRARHSVWNCASRWKAFAPTTPTPAVGSGTRGTITCGSARRWRKASRPRSCMWSAPPCKKPPRAFGRISAPKPCTPTPRPTRRAAPRWPTTPAATTCRVWNPRCPRRRQTPPRAPMQPIIRRKSWRTPCPKKRWCSCASANGSHSSRTAR